MASRSLWTLLAVLLSSAVARAQPLGQPDRENEDRQEWIRRASQEWA